MSYRDTARAFVMAEQSTRTGAAPTPEAIAADKLPLSDWSEARRDTLTPQTVAANHALHVSDTAHNLRETLHPDGFDWNAALTDGRVSLRAFKVEAAARALLAAIGEAGE